MKSQFVILTVLALLAFSAPAFAQSADQTIEEPAAAAGAEAPATPAAETPAPEAGTEEEAAEPTPSLLLDPLAEVLPASHCGSGFHASSAQQCRDSCGGPSFYMQATMCCFCA